MIKKIALLTAALFCLQARAPQYFAGSPKNVALAFTRHLMALEFDKAAALGTANTQAFLANLQKLYANSGGSPEKLKTELNKEIDPKKLNLTCKTTKDTAECLVCCNSLGESAAKPIRLVKIGKDWKVDMTKEN